MDDINAAKSLNNSFDQHKMAQTSIKKSIKGAEYIYISIDSVKSNINQHDW